MIMLYVEFRLFNLRELKSRIQAIMVETDRRRRGERKLEAGVILVKTLSMQLITY